MSKFSPVEFFKDCVVDKDNNVVSSEEFRGKTIGLYFSAHWCPPCRRFTPNLVAQYKKWTTEEKDKWEIIFISSDSSSVECDEYYKLMPWKRLRYSDREKKQSLSELFNVEGIPTLVLVSEEKGLITLEGRSMVTEVAAPGGPSCLML